MRKYAGITIPEWLFLVFIILSLFWYMVIQVSYPRVKRSEDLKSLDESSLDNGDLLFITGNTRGERTCRWFTNSEFCHVSMIFRQEGIVYTIDCDIGGHHHKDGVRVTTLRDKLSRKGLEDVICVRRLRTFGVQRPSSEQIMRVYEKYQHIDFDENMMSWFWSSFKKKDKMFCSEFMSVLLEELGVSSPTKPHNSHSPSSFMRNSTLHTTRGYWYGSCEYLLLYIEEILCGSI